MKKFYKDSQRRSPAMIIACVIFAIYAFTILFVIFFGIDVSLMSAADVRKGRFFPSSVKFVNYISAWTELSEIGFSLIEMTINSLWYSAGTSFFSILFSAMISYVVARYDYPGKRFVYGYAIVTMMIPILGATASEIKLYKMLGIYDTQFLIFMFTSSFGENFIIFFASYKSISWEYAEAASIDGAGHFTIWHKIMLPQIVSPMVALFMVGFIERWGDSNTALLYMKNHPSLASGMYIYGLRDSYNIPVYFAGFIMCMIPVLVLFLCFQKSIMDIQLDGGLKG